MKAYILLKLSLTFEDHSYYTTKLKISAQGQQIFCRAKIPLRQIKRKRKEHMRKPPVSRAFPDMLPDFEIGLSMPPRL